MPTMLADMQRARMLAYDLPANGWDVEVLAPGVRFQRRAWIDDDVSTLPPQVPIHEASPLRDGVFRALQVSSVGWRSFIPMLFLGCRILGKQRFDLVYITTTQFLLFCLGRIWKMLFRVPYALDFHDPWVRQGSRYVTVKQHWKTWLASKIARTLEKFAVNGAAGIVSVSPNYLKQLQDRHACAPGLQSGRSVVIPFAAMAQDLPRAVSLRAATAERTIAYVGAGGSIMAKSFWRICELISQIDPKVRHRLRIELFGTDSDWRPGTPKRLEGIAKEHGLDSLVSENPARITYTNTMQIISAADALLVLGVDDPAYMPSKLFLYALTGKPLLASLHAQSQANDYFRRLPGLGHLIHFECAEPRPNDVETTRSFIKEVVEQRMFDRRRLIASYLSPAAAQQHARFFEGLVAA